MGHTPTYENMVARCDGNIIIIDTGITPAYGGVLSALRVQYGLFPLEIHGSMMALNATTSRTRRWRELEIVHALYEGSSKELARSDKIIEGSFS